MPPAKPLTTNPTRSSHAFPSWSHRFCAHSVLSSHSSASPAFAKSDPSMCNFSCIFPTALSSGSNRARLFWFLTARPNIWMINRPCPRTSSSSAETLFACLKGKNCNAVGSTSSKRIISFAPLPWRSCSMIFQVSSKFLQPFPPLLAFSSPPRSISKAISSNVSFHTRSNSSFHTDAPSPSLSTCTRLPPNVSKTSSLSWKLRCVRPTSRTSSRMSVGS
mmetsp:Transcript_31800/g.74922  ORF Transcript_31800/g.74922 Transcript_31800/m.74922 type:complete len:219 (-) Transcript_31800:209-865(-)